MERLLKSLLIGAALTFGAAGGAQAITLGLDTSQADFADGVVNNGDQATAGGLTVTFSNIVTSNGASGGNVDMDGLFFSNDSLYADILSVDLVFSADVVFTGYSIAYDASSGGTFTLGGTNGTSGANGFSTVGFFAFNMGTIDRFVAGQTYTLTHSGLTGVDYAQIDSFEFEFAPAVPLPSSMLLIGTGLAGLGMAARRRRKA